MTFYMMNSTLTMLVNTSTYIKKEHLEKERKEPHWSRYNANISFASTSRARNAGDGNTPSSRGGKYALDQGDLDITPLRKDHQIMRERHQQIIFLDFNVPF